MTSARRLYRLNLAAAALGALAVITVLGVALAKISLAPLPVEELRAACGSLLPAELSPLAAALLGLAGLVLIVVAIASDPGEPRTTLLFGGLALVSLASLELAIREHFAGYRSHTTLLAAAAAVLVAVPLWFTPLPQEVLLLVALAAGVAAFRALRTVFERRAEGMSWRA